MKDKTIITLAAIIAITIIEMTALVVLGIDGILLGATVASIAGLGGYVKGKTELADQGVNQNGTKNKPVKN